MYLRQGDCEVALDNTFCDGGDKQPTNFTSNPTNYRTLDNSNLMCTKAKAKLSLCLTKHHAVNTYGGVEV